MDTPEYLWFLMARNLSGEATREQQEELLELLQKNPQGMQQYDMMKSLWKPAAAKQENDDEPARIRQILQLAASQAAEPPVVPVNRGKRLRRILLSGAAAAAAIALTWSVLHFISKDHSTSRFAQEEVVAQKGSKTRTRLPDGSTVWLNAGSKISFPSNFNGPVREVTLQGEAYFDVVKVPGKAFIVHADDINITVLGTAFNVKSYEEDKTVETTLIRGLVKITRGNTGNEEPILLKPSQKIVLQKNSPLPSQNISPTLTAKIVHAKAQVLNLDSTQKESELVETAWVYNRIEFRGDTFQELALKLERWYNIDVHFEDEEVKKLTFNGSLETETVEQAFLALKAAVPFRYEIRENEIYISGL